METKPTPEAEERLSLAEVGEICFALSEKADEELFEKFKRSGRGIRKQMDELERIARDAGVLQRGVSGWEYEASRLYVFLEALVEAEDWDDPMAVLGADESLQAYEGFVNWESLRNLALARARRAEDGGAAYEAVAAKLFERAEADRKELESFRETERHLGATLSGLLAWCSSREQLRALRRHLESSLKKVDDLLGEKRRGSAQESAKPGHVVAAGDEIQLTFRLGNLKELLASCH